MFQLYIKIKENNLFLMQALALITLALVHVVASIEHWYYKFTWFDIPTHFLGGVWVALLALTIINSNYKLIYKNKFVSVILFVAFIGISWELFEFISVISFDNDLPVNYLSDTASDLIMDFLGAFVAYIFVSRSKFNV